MGEVADMMLDGTLCQDCGAFIGEGLGFPRSCGCGKRVSRAVKRSGQSTGKGKKLAKVAAKVRCKICGRMVKEGQGLQDHMRVVHGGPEGAKGVRVTQEVNFCRIFRLPNTFPSDFCFSGGPMTQFRMVDWFNPVPMDTLPRSLDLEQMETLRNQLRDFIKAKNYFDVTAKFLAITDYGDAFVIEEVNDVG